MGFRIDSRLSKVAGLFVATVVLGFVTLRQTTGFRLGALGGPVETAVALGAVIVLFAVMVLNDSAFEG